MQSEFTEASADVFRTTMRQGTIGRNKTLSTSDALEAARAAARTELGDEKKQKKQNRKKRSNGATKKSKDGTAKTNPLSAPQDDDAEYADDSFDDEGDTYEDDFEIVKPMKASKGSSSDDAKSPGMVTVDVSADASFEATLHGSRRSKKGLEDSGAKMSRGKNRKGSDPFNETGKQRRGDTAGMLSTDDEVVQRRTSGLSVDHENLPPLQPSRGTGRGPTTSPPSGYTSDAVLSPLPQIRRSKLA